jgi:hypothetical protein
MGFLYKLTFQRNLCSTWYFPLEDGDGIPPQKCYVLMEDRMMDNIQICDSFVRLEVFMVVTMKNGVF